MDELKKSAKKKVLEEIMSMMDEKMADGLKSKSPKFQAVEVKAETKPFDAEELLKENSDESDDVSDEEKQRIKELYEKYFC